VKIDTKRQKKGAATIRNSTLFDLSHFHLLYLQQLTGVTTFMHNSAKKIFAK
jgi:hypothetical protein